MYTYILQGDILMAIIADIKEYFFLTVTLSIYHAFIYSGIEFPKPSLDRTQLSMHTIYTTLVIMSCHLNCPKL